MNLASLSWNLTGIYGLLSKFLLFPTTSDTLSSTSPRRTLSSTFCPPRLLGQNSDSPNRANSLVRKAFQQFPQIRPDIFRFLEGCAMLAPPKERNYEAKNNARSQAGGAKRTQCPSAPPSPLPSSLSAGPLSVESGQITVESGDIGLWTLDSPGRDFKLVTPILG